MNSQSKVKSMEGFASCTCLTIREGGAPSSLTSLVGVMGEKPLRWILGQPVLESWSVRYAPYCTNRPSTNPMRQSGVVDNRTSQSIPQNVVEETLRPFSPFFSPGLHIV